MATTYRLFLSDGSFDQAISPETTVTDHGLTFVGQGETEYGSALNHNVLHMLENFADNTAPSNPLTGQMWFNTTAGTLSVWNGSSWSSFATDDYILGGTYAVSNGTSSVTLPRNVSAGLTISNIATIANLNAHINDTVDAHDAFSLSFSVTGTIPYSTPQVALEYVDRIIYNHTVDTVDAHDASAISVVNAPIAHVSATNAQSAIDGFDNYMANVQTSIDNVNTARTNHLNDSIDAHDASAISFDDTNTTIVADDVQEALVDIVNAAGSSGSLEIIRVGQSGSQAIGTSYTKLLFPTVVVGNTSGAFNTGTSVYTAAFKQEINISLSVVFVTEVNRDGGIEIRKNGTSIRTNIFHNKSNDDGGTEYAQSKESTVKAILNAGDTIDCWIYATPANGLNATNGGSNSCHVTFEIIRVL